MIVTDLLAKAMGEGVASIRERIRDIENEIEKDPPKPTVLKICLQSLEELRIYEAILSNAVERYNEEKTR